MDEYDVSFGFDPSALNAAGNLVGQVGNVLGGLGGGFQTGLSGGMAGGASYNMGSFGNEAQNLGASMGAVPGTSSSAAPRMGLGTLLFIAALVLLFLVLLMR